MKRIFALCAVALITALLVMPLVCYADDVIVDDSSTHQDDDPTDVYHSIRGVILHYVYGDDVSDVPFGTGWADMIASILSCLLLLAPFLLVVMIVRSII